MTRLKALFAKLEDQPYHPALLFFLALIAGIGRTVEEIYLAHRSLSINIASHYGAFYLATAFGFTAIAAAVLRLDWRRVSRFVGFGVLVGLAPPLIDALWLGPGRFRYSYLDGFYPTLHGAGNPYSEAIAAWTALAAFAVYLYLRGRSWARAALGFALAYAFVLGLVSLTPPAFKEFLLPIKAGSVKALLYLVLSYAIYVGLNFRRFWPSLKRINHSLPWVFLVFLGAELAGGSATMTWLQAGIVLFVHQGVVFANDYYDRASDAINRREGRIDGDDVFAIHVIIWWIAVHVCLMNARIGLLYFIYLLLTTAYHHPRFRLKDVFALNYATEGAVAALALLIGMASANLTSLSARDAMYVALAFLGFALASPFKDYKDIDGDTATGTATVYVLLTKKGWTSQRTHRWVTAIVFAFTAMPLAFLWLKQAPAFLIGAFAAVFLLPVFFTLRLRDRKAAVERTAWVLTAYIAALAAALAFALPRAATLSGGGAMTDYALNRSDAERYASEHPTSVEEVVSLLNRANAEKAPVRVRGKGHSMNGSSLPRNDELVIFTDRMRSYRFEEPGTITVGAGVGMGELRSFLNARGYALPVVPDGRGGPSVGGYIAAGGIGGGSRTYGGFWGNVLEIRMVTGAGVALTLKPGDEAFPWMFGSMGQLGVFVSAKLKLLDAETRSYPVGESGLIAESAPREDRRLVWFTVFVPKAEQEAAKSELARIKAAHPDDFEYRPDYVYPMAFSGFTPKLVFPVDGDFVGVGLWGYPNPERPEAMLGVEKDVMGLVTSRAGVPYRRYIQTEIVAPGTDYRAYFGDALFDEFSEWKKRLDPLGLLNCGTVFPCPVRP